MSLNTKRCSSGNSSMIRSLSQTSTKHLTNLSRSKTCGMPNTPPTKTKHERLQPLITNKTSQLNDQTLVDNIDCLHPAMVNELCLHGKELSIIPNLSQFSKLQVLDLSCNNLKRIDNLRSLSNLRELKLYGNQIEKIENLECLIQLQILQLQYNQIEIIGSGLMHLTRLQTIRLDSNKLSLVRSDELIKLTQLKSLDLSDCSIENFDFLNSLISLNEFHASNCSLKILPNIQRNLRNLLDLNLSYNQLNNINSLKILTSLRILHLSHNHIVDIQILSTLIHLNELNLSFNHIEIIPNTFEKLIELQYFNLSNNQIHSWDNIKILARMNGLFIFNIQNNPLTTIVENYIEKLSKLCPSLEIIDDIYLKDNQLTTNLDEQILGIDQELKEIDQQLERSIVAVETQFISILNDLQILKSNENDNLSSINKKTSKHRLFQALTFSEENYQ